MELNDLVIFLLLSEDLDDLSDPPEDQDFDQED